LYGVAFSSATNLTAIGGDPSRDYGVILRTTNGGNNWVKSQSATSYPMLYSVCYPTPSTGIIVGNKGTILRTTDGGATWAPRISGTTIGLRGVSFSDPYYGTVVGDGMTILQTIDGGLTWSVQSSGSNSNLYAVSFVDPSHGTIVGEGGAILSTSLPGSVVAVDDGNEYGGTTSFSLSQNYPNPFNPTTAISYQLSAASFVELKIFDILGREIATLVKEKLSLGLHKTVWNAVNFPSGVYFYRLQTDGKCLTRKLLLVK
jgi:hypothetical protein